MTGISVGKLWYPVVTLGYGKRLGVWVQGCKKECVGCISPELRSFSAGHVLTAEQILDKLPRDAIIDGLTISGGEPFEQVEGILELIKMFRSRYTEDILIFTGYTMEELYHGKSDKIKEIFENIAVLVDGQYIESKNSGVGLRGSDNQRIHVFKCHEKYKDAEMWKRNMQCVQLKNRLWMIGIPQR